MKVDIVMIDHQSVQVVLLSLPPLRGRVAWRARRYWPTRTQALNSRRRLQARADAIHGDSLAKFGRQSFQYAVVPGEAYTLPAWPGFALVTHALHPSQPNDAPLRAAVFRGRYPQVFGQAQTWPELIIQLLQYRLRSHAGSDILRTYKRQNHPEHTLEFILSVAKALKQPVPVTAEQAIRGWITIATALYGHSRRVSSWWQHQVVQWPERLIPSAGPPADIIRSDGFAAVGSWGFDTDTDRDERIKGAYADQATADEAIGIFRARERSEHRLVAAGLYACARHPGHRLVLTSLRDRLVGPYCASLFRVYDLTEPDIEAYEREFLLASQLHVGAYASTQAVALLKLIGHLIEDTFVHWPVQSPRLLDLPLGALALNGLALPKGAARRLTKWEEATEAAQAQYRRASEALCA